MPPGPSAETAVQLGVSGAEVVHVEVVPDVVPDDIPVRTDGPLAGVRVVVVDGHPRIAEPRRQWRHQLDEFLVDLHDVDALDVIEGGQSFDEAAESQPVDQDRTNIAE